MHSCNTYPHIHETKGPPASNFEVCRERTTCGRSSYGSFPLLQCSPESSCCLLVGAPWAGYGGIVGAKTKQSKRHSGACSAKSSVAIVRRKRPIGVFRRSTIFQHSLQVVKRVAASLVNPRIHPVHRGVKRAGNADADKETGRPSPAYTHFTNQVQR